MFLSSAFFPQLFEPNESQSGMGLMTQLNNLRLCSFGLFLQWVKIEM